MLACLGMVAALAVAGTVEEGTEAGAAAADKEIPGVEDLLGRIARYRKLSPESAQVMQQALETTNDAVMEMDLALLEAFGPAPVHDPDRARTRLGWVLESGEPALQAAGQSLLEFIVVELERQQARTRRHAELESELERERAAHAETRDKLDALRRIDEELEVRENGPEQPPP